MWAILNKCDILMCLMVITNIGWWPVLGDEDMDVNTVSPYFIGSDSCVGQVNNEYVDYSRCNYGTCFLADFVVHVSVKPINDSFIGSTFCDLNPIKSNSRLTECDYEEDNGLRLLAIHYNKFNNFKMISPNHKSSLSVGFDINLDLSFNLDIKYTEAICNEEETINECFYKRCDSDNLEKLQENNCLVSHVNYMFGQIKANQSYECSHNWKTTHKDIVYVNEIAFYRSVITVDFDYIHIDYTNRTDDFNDSNHCILDWILHIYTIATVISIVLIIIILISIKCFIDSRKDRRRLRLRYHKTSNDMKTNYIEE